MEVPAERCHSAPISKVGEEIDMVDATITEKDRVQVLLAEYQSLRSQIIARGGSMIQTATIGVVGLGIVASQLRGHPYMSVSILVIFGVLTFFITRIIMMYTAEEAAQIRRLERDVNARTGESLLTWESDRGRCATGYLHGFWDFRGTRISN